MFKLYIKKWREVVSLISRNIFVLVNLITFTVALLLLFFGDIKEGIFIAVIIFINTVISIVRDVHTWTTLENLQLLTSVKFIRINADSSETQVLSEEIKMGDKIKIKLGDQVPCDSKLVSSSGLEVNEGMITGESNSLSKVVGDMVFAGSVVTAGSGALSVSTSFAESRITKMTKDIKKHYGHTSLIQDSVNKIVRYSGYVLLVVIIFVIYRGIEANQEASLIIKNIGALASMLVPQGLVIATTLMFSYGAIHSYRRHVLLQDLNAVEKLGRIKNLCLDKTGTLTESILSVEGIFVPDENLLESAKEISSEYVKHSGDDSETIFAINSFINKDYKGESINVLPFSSSRSYGAVMLGGKLKNTIVLAGAPEIFLESIAEQSEKEWLNSLINTNAKLGKRIICFTKCLGEVLPHSIESIKCSVVAVFVLNNNLREGIVAAVKFFQDRGVRIRVISGDNPETVRVVSVMAGVNSSEAVMSGLDMEKWTKDEIEKNIKQYNVFARIKPEQKEIIIEALKKDGFTAMVGDGANDALAIKKADLGIAMFDGATATRQLASVVLTENSFSELPGGVRLADNVIENIEIFTNIFLNQTFLGFLLFIFVTLFGYTYPFTLLNITLINYSTIGIPSMLILYWTTHPREIKNTINQYSFLKKVFPFPVLSTLPQLAVLISVLYVATNYLKETKLNTIIALTLMAIGVVFFYYVQSLYSGGKTTNERKKQFIFIIVSEIIVLYFGLKIHVLAQFYNVTSASFISVVLISVSILAYFFAQLETTKMFIKTNFYLQKNKI